MCVLQYIDNEDDIISIALSSKDGAAAARRVKDSVSQSFTKSEICNGVMQTFLRKSNLLHGRFIARNGKISVFHFGRLITE